MQLSEVTESVWAADAFTPPLDRFQLTDGSARCTRVAIGDDEGTWRRYFRQGERVHFYFEFEISRDIEFPAGGVELISETGHVVHGKNTFQQPVKAPPSVRRGSRLRYHQWMDLQVSPGIYKVCLTLAGTDRDSYEGYVNGPLSHEQFAPRMREQCRVLRADNLTITYAAGDKLSHHGLANLPGGASLEVVEPANHQGQDPEEAARVASGEWPTTFHVTHWKAGSQWIHKILRQCAPERIAEPLDKGIHVRYYPIQRGYVYPTVYLGKTEMDQVPLPAGSKRFVVIRDLRDTLISAYFSLKVSHPILAPHQAETREKLCKLPTEDGLLSLLETFLPLCADIQLSWLDAGEPVLKYEDLLSNDVELLEQVLIGYCGLPLDPARLREIVLANRFEALTRGRPRGTEDITAHERKGVAGDWRNYFTERLKRAFNARFGGLLVAAGYEKDLCW